MMRSLLVGIALLLATSFAVWAQGAPAAPGEASKMEGAAIAEMGEGMENVESGPKKGFPIVPVAIVIAVVAGGAALVMKKKAQT